MIDDSKSMYTKQERAEIYKYVAARFLVGKFASSRVYDCVRVSAYLYNHLATVIDPQCVGEVADDFPEFFMQYPGGLDSNLFGTMTQWHDKIWYKQEDYINNCIEWLDGALKICQNG